MKFSDIPKYTSWGNYAVHHDLKYFKDTISKYIEDGLQLNPDFQRGHVWTEKQQIAFMEYLLRGGMSGRDLFFNHPGWMTSFDGDFVCVDGLQRITAALRFLNNEIPVFCTYYKDFEDKLPSDAYFYVHINDLKTRKEVLQWYIEFNSGGTVHTEEEIDRVRKLLEKEEGNNA